MNAIIAGERGQGHATDPQPAPRRPVCATAARQSCGTSPAADRPYWLTEPCPAWCVGGHRADDEPGERIHIPAWMATVDLTLQPHTPRNLALFRDYRDAMGNAVMPAPFVQVHVFQNVGETHPRITVAVDDDPKRGFVGTVAEIDDLISRLIEARDLANGHVTPQAPAASKEA